MENRPGPDIPALHKSSYEHIAGYDNARQHNGDQHTHGSHTNNDHTMTMGDQAQQYHGSIAGGVHHHYYETWAKRESEVDAVRTSRVDSVQAVRLDAAQASFESTVQVSSAYTAQNVLKVIVDPGSKTEVEYVKDLLNHGDVLTPAPSIVAVHGINSTNTASDTDSTWTKGDKMWLRDFIPQKLDTARIMLFGYNANIAFEKSARGVLQQAHHLLECLHHKRRRARQRPVIFIAHSLGGIVVKRVCTTVPAI